MSSWYFKSVPSVDETFSGSSATTLSVVSACAQLMVSAMPGFLYRSMARIDCTNATICRVSCSGASGAFNARIAFSRAASGKSTQ